MITRPLDRPIDAPRGRLAWMGAASLLVGGGVALAVLLVFRPDLAIGCVALLAVTGLCVARPLYGLVAILAGIALLGSDSVLRIQTGIQWVEADLLLLAAAVGWVVRMLAFGLESRWTALDRAVLLFGVMIVIGVFVGLGRGTSLEELRAELRPPGYLIVGYAIARSTIRDGRTVRAVYMALLAVTIISAIKTLAVYAAVPLGPPGGAEQLVLATRVMNSGGFKRVIAHGAEIFPILSVIYLLSALTHSRSVLWRLLGWLTASLLLLVITLSLTRSYWAGLGAGVMTLVLAMSARRMTILREGVGIAVTALCLVMALQSFVPGFNTDSIGEIIGERALSPTMLGHDPSVRARLNEVAAIGEALRDHPWIGLGLGGTYVFYSGIGGGIREWEYAHNSYAYWAMKLGLFGLLAFLGVLALGVWAGLDWKRRSANAMERATAGGVVAGLVALLVISIGSPWLTHYVGSAWAGLAIGCCEAMRLSSTEAT